MLADPDRTDTDLRRHIREAATATGYESGHQIEIQLGHYCNNRCVFCVSGQLTEMGLARPIGTDPVFSALERAAAKGIRRVTFLGGEPTIQDSFMPSLRRALELGFDEVVIFTNGARGKSTRFLESVLALGDFTWRFSIQGGNAAAHDAVTGRKGSFARIIRAMAFLAERGQDITANMCVTRQSYASLPDYPALVARHGIRQLHMDVVRPENAGQRDEAHLRSIIPRHSEMAPAVAEMLAGFEVMDPDYDVNIGNMPYCVLPEWAHAIHHGGEPTLTLTTGDGGALDQLLHKYDFQRIDAVYADGCPECVFRPSCRGVPEKYAAFFGTDELVPVTRERLLAIDTRQRAFTLAAEPWIEALLRAAPPPGYAAAAVARDHRARRARVRFQGAGLPPLEWVLSPAAEPHAGAPSLWLGAHFRLGLARATPALAAWARAALEAAGHPVQAVSTAPAPERAVAALLATVRRLKGIGRFGAWRLRRVEPQASPPGAHLTLAGPGGAQVVLHLTAGDRLDARFELGAGTDEALARPLVRWLSPILAGRAPDPARPGPGLEAQGPR